MRVLLVGLLHVGHALAGSCREIIIALHRAGGANLAQGSHKLLIRSFLHGGNFLLFNRLHFDCVS